MSIENFPAVEYGYTEFLKDEIRLSFRDRCIDENLVAEILGMDVSVIQALKEGRSDITCRETIAEIMYVCLGGKGATTVKTQGSVYARY